MREAFELWLTDVRSQILLKGVQKQSDAMGECDTYIAAYARHRQK